MLHRTVLGSIERFLGILIEQFAGASVVSTSAGGNFAYRRKTYRLCPGNKRRYFYEEIRGRLMTKMPLWGLKSEKQKWKSSLPCYHWRPGDGEPYTEYPET